MFAKTLVAAKREITSDLEIYMTTTHARCSTMRGMCNRGDKEAAVRKKVNQNKRSPELP